MVQRASPRMIRVADYIVGRLADHGIDHVFMVTGGRS